MEKDIDYNRRIQAERAKNPFISQTDLVYNLLRDDITLTCRKLGSKINQDQLGSMLQVSRSPIRDAIKRLVDENLLIKLGNRGYYVYIPTMKDVTYISELRVALETTAAQLAIKRVTDEELQILWEVIKEQEAQNPQDINRMIELDMQFHNHLVACSKSKYIIQAYQQYKLQFHLLYIRIITKKMRNIIFSQHEDIFYAIRDKDSGRLESILRMHLNMAEDFINAPEYFYE